MNRDVLEDVVEQVGVPLEGLVAGYRPSNLEADALDLVTPGPEPITDPARPAALGTYAIGFGRRSAGMFDCLENALPIRRVDGIESVFRGFR